MYIYQRVLRSLRFQKYISFNNELARRVLHVTVQHVTVPPQLSSWWRLDGQRSVLLQHRYNCLEKTKYNNQDRKECSTKTTIIGPRSPYAVLKLKKSATEEDIKSQFRKLAKENHPDLNPHLPPHIAQSNMSELIHAYNVLMNDDLFSNVVGDERVSLACEMFTLHELKMDRFHQVFSIRIKFSSNDNDDDNGTHSCTDNIVNSYVDNLEYNSDTKFNKRNYEIDNDHNIDEEKEVPSTEILLDHIAHPHDSISDVKRQLQSLYQSDWGLRGRRLNRDRIAIGWEIAKTKKSNDNDVSLEVMSYHLFLHSYDISDGDIIYAIVRKDL